MTRTRKRPIRPALRPLRWSCRHRFGHEGGKALATTNDQLVVEAAGPVVRRQSVELAEGIANGSRLMTQIFQGLGPNGTLNIFASFPSVFVLQRGFRLVLLTEGPPHGPSNTRFRRKRKRKTVSSRRKPWCSTPKNSRRKPWETGENRREPEKTVGNRRKQKSPGDNRSLS